MNRVQGMAVLLISAGLPLAPASAVDLTVQSIEVNQADQYGSTKLFGQNLTWIRVKIGVTGSAAAVPGVDAVLRVFVAGQPFIEGAAPVYSLNGPIVAPLSPAVANINDTINFAVIPPISSDVDFVVEVNPGHTVEETNLTNNILALNDRNFECRKIMEVAYVPINYTPGGGLPQANLIEPGIGDGFLRGIYHPNEWNYHRSPLPPLVWNQQINGSSAQLLNTLKDIRINQIPDAGYPQPDFVFGWLPGNPFSGNGQAIGVPGDAAFGNTDTTRHQRTFAHELGHCFGLQHNSATINTIGVDTERHLKDTQNLAQLFGTTKKDIMVAGQLTNAAWVAQNTYNVVHNDSRMQCQSGLAGDPPLMPLIRISGIIDHTMNTVALNNATLIALGEPTSNDPAGNTKVVALDAAGNVMAQVTVKTGTNRQLCTENALERPILSPTSPLYVLLPLPPEGQVIERVEVFDRATNRSMGSMNRSPNAPQASLAGIVAGNMPIDQDGQNPGVLQGPLHVEWNAVDPDGDPVTHTLLYNPQGTRWVPIVVNTSATSLTFDSSEIPSSGPDGGVFKLISSDGLNIVQSQIQQAAAMAPNPPELYILTPNNNDAFPQLAPVAFHAAAWDMEDLMLSDQQIVWTSSIDGVIGIGIEFIQDQLSPGIHTITATATDASELFASRTITVTINPRSVIDPDCNGNGTLDELDIASGASIDADGNGQPDECVTICSADINGDSTIDANDMAQVLEGWGDCSQCALCESDVDRSCVVDVNDLLAIINQWGPCD